MNAISLGKAYLGAALLLLALTACATTPGGWGKDATLTPGWKRVGDAAVHAVTSPFSWAPVAAAIALRYDHADENLQEWAGSRTPLFGSTRDADQMSDNFLHAGGALWLLSGLAATDISGEGLAGNVTALGVETGAGIATRSYVGIRKDITQRRAPNGVDREGFPSGHITEAALFATLASRHVDAYGWSSGAETAADIGLGALVAATAWARIEADQHYPTDALGSIAIGHAIGLFVSEAFIGTDNPRNIVFLAGPVPGGGGAATLSFDF